MKKKNNNGKQSYIFTRETFGMTIMLFSLVVAVMLLTHRTVFAGLGGAICTFMYGTFGYGSYLILAALCCLGYWLVFEKFAKLKMSVVGVIAAVAISAFLLFHAVTTRNYSLASYGDYLSTCYNNARAGYSGYTFGGVISGLVVYPIARGTTFIGAYVIFSLMLAASAYLAFVVIRRAVLGEIVAKEGREENAETEEEKEEKPEIAEPAQAEHVDNLYSLNDKHEIVKAKTISDEGRQARRYPSDEGNAPAEKSDEEKQAEISRKILFEPGEFAAESYRRNLIFNEDSYFNHPIRNEGDYLKSFSDGKTAERDNSAVPDQSYTENYSDEAERSASDNPTPSYLYGERPVDDLTDVSPDDEPADGYDRYTVGGDRTDYTDDTSDESGQTYPDPVQDEREDGYGENSFGGRNDDVSRGEDTMRGDEPLRGMDNARGIDNRRGMDDMRERDNLYGDESADGEGQESSSMPERARSERQAEDIYSLFGSANPRAQGGREEPPAREDRTTGSRENIFDDDGEEEDNLFGGTGSLSGGNREAGRGQFDTSPREPTSPDITARSSESASDTRRDILMPDAGGRASGDSAPIPPAMGRAPAEKAPEPAVREPEKAEEKPKHVWKRYVRPSLELLDDYPENNNVNTAEIEESKRIICETLSSFRIASEVSNVVVGPAITRYDVVIEDKTNIKNALKYKEAIAMALMKENVNAYLNYSKGAISIEVPNNKRSVVGLKSMLASSQFINCKPNTLTFALGKNVEGQVVCPDITKMPHLLVAGTTGSGKSICLSALIVSLLYKYGPEELRFILVDPKQVEFISYDKLPHLMINEIIYDVDKAIKALNWAIKEMEDRYAKFKEMTERGIATKNLTEYNAHLPEGEEKLPKIVIILDEFGDLMLQAKKEIEGRIIRLVQKARACGIHLILATQRPSVDCITGLIKSNLPTRIGFKVNSFDDARCIFDIGGAEKLLGKGDLYYRSAENPELARVQGCFIDTPEVQRVTDFIKENNETYFDQTVSDFINTVEEPEDSGSDDSSAANTETKIDDFFIKALKFCVTSNQASVSMIQRRFPIGYMKACKIIDWMENMNYITQSEGSKPRKVLLSREEFIRIFGDVDD